MIKISGYAIVKNEEEYLPYSLGIMDRVCDELIIVDNGSTDRTKEIAKSFSKVKLIEKPSKNWLEIHEPELRMIAIKECKGDWIQEFDADEVFYESIIKIRELLEELNNRFGGICFPYHQLWGDFEHVKDERRPNLNWQQHIFGKSLLYRNHPKLERSHSIHHSHIRHSFDPPRIYDFGLKEGYGTSPGNNYYGLMRIQDRAGDNKELMIDWKKMEPFWFCHFGYCKSNKKLLDKNLHNAILDGKCYLNLNPSPLEGSKVRPFMKEPERIEKGTLPKIMKNFKPVPKCKVKDGIIIERSY